MQRLLFPVAPSDLATFAAVVSLVMLAAAIAAYIPGRRAARSEVSSLLRHI